MQSVDMTEAEMTREEVEALIAAAPPGQPPDLTKRRLSGLDLSGIDFKGADLHWVRLNNSNLRGTNLQNCRIDLGWLIGADLEGADLSGASLFSTQMQRTNLKHAKLDGARITANLKGANLSGASLREADMAADMKNQSMGLMRISLKSANLDGADLRGARAGRADIEFASLRGAQLQDADFTRAEFAGADLTGASIAGTNLTEADVASARLIELKGIDTAIGLSTLRNLQEAITDWEVPRDGQEEKSTEAEGPNDELQAVQDMIRDVKSRVRTVDTETLKQMIDNEEDFVLLDVRTPLETQAGWIDASQHVALPRGWLEVKILNHVIDKDTPIVTYCGIGIRSAFAAETLEQMGFSDVRNYEEGFTTWRSRGHPVAQ
jgi:uncharacterized protein YjbI with pentapeptide repeats/rhodanese-related sulfurtransferase